MTTQAKEAAGISRFVLELQPGTQAQVCGICREEVPGKELVAIGCGHFFCQPCYTAYLCSKVDEGATCPLTRCPEFKCPEIVTENFFKTLAPPDKFATYQR